MDEQQDNDEDLLSPNLDVILNEVFESSASKKRQNSTHVNQIYNSDDEDDDDEGDYAPDSDECSI